MKKLMMTVATVAMATAAFCAPKRGVQAMAGSDEGPMTAGREAKVNIDQPPKVGGQCLLGAPRIDGASNIGQCYTKPRSWIVIETKYTTYAKFLDQLTFTWHVLLETKTAKENKGNKLNLPPYSYFNTSVTYFNIPQGSHAACVCLPPSYYELYGEPRVVGFTVSNQNGDILAGDTVSAMPNLIKAHEKFWEENKKFQDGMSGDRPAIVRRQGLVDRSKTIWALVNPNDYEATMQ